MLRILCLLAQNTDRHRGRPPRVMHRRPHALGIPKAVKLRSRRGSGTAYISLEAIIRYEVVNARAATNTQIGSRRVAIKILVECRKICVADPSALRNIRDESVISP